MTAEILDKIGSYTKAFDKARVLKAFDFVAEKYTYAENNKNCHLHVLEILLPLKPDEDTIVAILLHDLYVNSLVSDETVRQHFGQGVLEMLTSLKRLHALNYEENDKGMQLEVLRKMFMTLAKDIRVILIWLAHRLSIMQHIVPSMDSARSRKIAKETMNVYVPIASRLGIYKIKIQLEDLAFQYLNPEEYGRLTEQVKQFTEQKMMPIEYIKNQLGDFLKSRGVEVEIQGRIKNVYSIYTKLAKKGYLNVGDLYDFFAIRVILPVKPSYDHLYMVLGLIHSEWKPISGRFKDYVAVPKPNGYRSLHTVVLGLGPKGLDRPVEIQIRDERMHREAEYGVASHWLYKAKRSSSLEDLSKHADWIRGLEQIHEFFGSESSEVMKEVEIDIFKDRIFVLTPRGEVKDLPVGAITLDFAYAVHTDVGSHCISAKVNGMMVPLDYQLKNGDVVEIIVRNDAVPKLKWLSMVKSSFAKNKIKTWFSGLNRDKNIKLGRELINAQLERLNKPLLNQGYSLLKNFGDGDLTLSQRENLLEEIGRGSKVASEIVKKLYPYEKILPAGMSATKFENLQNKPKSRGFEDLPIEEQVIVGKQTGLPIKIASCCMPQFSQRIVGYVNSKNKCISIHRFDCSKLDTFNREKIIFAEWKGHEILPNETGFKVGIDLTIVSRLGLIQDISSVISRMKINILDVMIKKGKDGFYHDYFLLDLNNLNQFDELLDRLEEVSGVMKVVRADQVFRNYKL
ncbi:bifunctional (p)ppGpp synthetase/guanosine-3',5'-bis(diphosphate) 3'-pyrophosphohydrolase [Candidatus Peregrinibacteria bacterium]|nr:bifunctional (p)ppGpp synthetase/guanosine-3',5'-bis(diphosphate) 3'-pyrophosphohydrolase [Candidatus Peregrinibacteria bacterium]